MGGHSARKLKSESSTSELEYLREEIDLIQLDELNMEEKEVDFDVPSKFVQPFWYRKRTLNLFLGEEAATTVTVDLPGKVNEEEVNSTVELIMDNCMGWTITEVFLELEEVLKRKREELKDKLIQVNREMVEKVKQVRRLTRKIARLEEGETVDQSEMGEGMREAVLILPEEVWRIIFELFPGSDWRALMNCSKVCSLFRRIILPTYNTTLLFGQLFPILYNYEDMERADILECRLVCKSWKAGVDHLYENHPSFRPHNDEKSNPRSVPFLEPSWDSGLCFDLDWDEDEYSGAVAHEGNPFFGRCHNTQVPCYLSKKLELAMLLRANGQHIWYLNLFTGPESTGYLEDVEPPVYDLSLDQLLTFLPNLRKLCVYSDNYESKPWQEDTSDMSADLLPDAPNLETLQIEALLQGEAKLSVDAMLWRYHPQMGRLHLGLDSWKMVSHLEWPNLKELHLRLDPSDSPADTLLQAIMPNLRKFGMAPMNSLLSKFGWSWFLNFISKLSATTQLNTLRITEHAVEEMQEWISNFSSFLHAPITLKTLEVEHFVFYDPPLMTSYSFLLHFPFLENPNVFWREPDENSYYDWVGRGDCYSMEAITLPLPDTLKWVNAFSAVEDRPEFQDELVEVNRYIYKCEMYKSNIWKLLPNLKVFTFQKDLYTREGYQLFQKRNFIL